MKILHAVAPAEFGGLEEVVLRLAGGLQERGHQVSVASVLSGTRKPHPFLDAVESTGVDAHARFVPHRRYRLELAELEDLYRTLKPHVVHTHGYRSDVLHSRPARRLGIPLVTTLHGFIGNSLKGRMYEWMQVRSVRSFDAVVAVSRPIATLVGDRGVPASSIHTVPNAWAARRTLKPRAAARAVLGVSAEGFRVGWVGRLGHEKGPDVFTEALALLSDVELEASIVGDGRLRAELESRVSGIDNLEITLHGAVPDAGRLLAAFDLVVLSSRTEGTPIVLLEAMAAGVPVVSTSVGGVPDVIDDDSALLVPSEDPVALARAIRSVHADRDAARQRAKRASRRLEERFAVGPWLQRYEEIYASVARHPTTASNRK